MDSPDRSAQNAFENVQIEQGGFAYQNLLGRDKWVPWTVAFGSLTVVGTPTYTGRLKYVGRQVFFQVKIVPSTSIASAAGTDYLTLPVAAKGVAGMATMTNDTTNVAVGVCHIDTTTSRCYLPAQVASGNVFTISGWYEI